MNIGQTIRYIRKSKNILVDDICNDVMDRANYWRFEQGYISTSTDNFIKILNKLNIEIDEFIFLYNNEEQKSYKEIKANLLSASKTDNSKECLKIGEMALNKYQETNMLRYLHLSELAILFSEKINKLSKLSRPNNIIKYLSKCDNWDYYEITLYNNILFIFSFQDAIILGEKLIESLQKKKKTRPISDDDILILVNLISYSIQLNEKEIANKLINQADSLNISESETYSRICLGWIKAIYEKKYIDPESESLEKILNILEYLEMFDTKKMLEKWSTHFS